jgi:predicted dehydrogenase
MEKPLKTGIMGLDEPGRLLLEAARNIDLFKISAVADSNATLAQQEGKLWDCPAYDDYRQLIIANQLDCLFVAAPLHTCAEYLKMALKKKFSILNLPPLARNFSEAAEFVKLAQTEGVMFAVANPDRFTPGALALRSFTLENPDEQFFFILAASGSKNYLTAEHAETAEEIVARASSPCRPALESRYRGHGQDGRATSAFSAVSAVKWRSDPLLAGGGVLLYDCWEVIDWIVWNFGVPQQVYCVTGSTAADSRQRAYLAEDSAIMTMKFSDILSGGLLAGRAAETLGREKQKWLSAQGCNVLIKVDDRSFDVKDAEGRQIKREEFEDDFPGRLKKALENLGSNLLWPDQNPLICTAADNLKIMAVIEAAYLSARTGMPEEPGRILKIA